MDYIKEYKSFINSHYLSEGVRITIGVVLPAMVLNHFGMLPHGVVVSLGAMSISITDNPGPIHHRKNGMLAALIINTLIAIATGFAAPFPLLLAVLIVAACFVFSMIGVFGTRANSVGVSALLIMVLNIDRHHHGWEVVLNAAFILSGAAWYMLLSLVLYSFRPYRLAQQALGECINATADYLRIRASFYEKEVDYEHTYREMMEQQIAVHEKQNLVRELLFKSRHIVKESTVTGRTLVMIFTDTVDLFERTMSSYADYKALHDAFAGSDLLEKYRVMVLALSNELDEIGIAVKSGDEAKDTGMLATKVEGLKKYFEDFRDRNRTPANVQDFISMKHILDSISDIASRIRTLHLYSSYDKDVSQRVSTPVEYDKFISHQPIEPDLLLDNLSFQSNNFRHAIRISIATLLGYVVSLFFTVGHSYWILLTIIVILKPAYSLTKKRNYERLIGTVAGALVGLVILYFIQNNQVLFVIMLLLMVGTYSLLRTNYMFSVIFMTPYILLLFHLLNNDSFKTIITDRILDTAIGSVIAFVANLILLPAWEQEKISGYMTQAVKSNKDYFKDVAAAFTGTPVTITAFKVSRKNAFVALANLSDAFTRMLSEPKRRQKNIKQLHQFVVLNHMLSSHIATLAYYVPPLAEKLSSNDFIQPMKIAVAKLEDAEKILEEIPAEKAAPENSGQNKIRQRLQELLDKRRVELQNGIIDTATKKQLTDFKPVADQFTFIDNIAGDLKKTGTQWMEDLS